MGLLCMAGMTMKGHLAQSTRTRRAYSGPNVVWITTSTIAQKKSGRASMDMIKSEYKQDNNQAPRTPDLKTSRGNRR